MTTTQKFKRDTAALRAENAAARLESPSAELCATTPPLKLPPPALLDHRLYELLVQFKTWEDNERLAARKYAHEAVNEIQRCAFERAATYAQQAAVANAQANGLSMASDQLKNVLRRLEAAAAERGEA